MKDKRVYYAILIPSAEKKTEIAFLKSASITKLGHDGKIRKSLDRMCKKIPPKEIGVTLEGNDSFKIELYNPKYFSNINENNDISNCQYNWDDTMGFKVCKQPVSNKNRKVITKSPHKVPKFIHNLITEHTKSNEKVIPRKPKKSVLKSMYSIPDVVSSNNTKPNNNNMKLAKVINDYLLEETLDTEKLFVKELSMSDIATQLKNYSSFNNTGKIKLFQSDNDKFFGAISSKFFESVGWKSKGFDVISSTKIKRLTVDVDQVYFI
jgi:hypothetical protein